MENKKAAESGTEGFTLLEVIIAIAIMVLAFTSILTVESSSINASMLTRQLNTVAMLAKGKMVDTEYLIEGKTFDEMKKEDGSAFEAPFQDYRWATKIKEIEFPQLATGKKSGGGDSSGGGNELADMLTRLLTKFLSKAIREVTVTVFWKKGATEQSYSVSTYWVDLNHEFALSEQ